MAFILSQCVNTQNTAWFLDISSSILNDVISSDQRNLIKSQHKETWVELSLALLSLHVCANGLAPLGTGLDFGILHGIQMKLPHNFITPEILHVQWWPRLIYGNNYLGLDDGLYWSQVLNDDA